MNVEKPLGIIAGKGILPQVVARNASAQGFRVVTIAFFSEVFDVMKPCSDEIYQISIGLVNKVIKTLKKAKVEDLVMIGKFEKKMLFENLRFDFTALTLLRKMINKNDDTLMLAIVNELQKNGIIVRPQIDFLQDISPTRGVLTKKKPSSREIKDIEYGFALAKKMAGLDIGQTIVVKEQAVLAVEAIEGTDEAIKRGCALGKGGVTVVKVSKPKQDPRFDLPTVGENTLRSMRAGGASLLAVEAEKTILVNKNKLIEYANEMGIGIIAI